MAVSMNVDYTRQLYTGLSTDDWGSVEFNPGDVTYIMDRSECWIFDGSTMHQLPDLGGGGGSGYTANDWMDFTKPEGAVYSEAVVTNTSTDWPPVFQNHTGITSIRLPNATSLPANFCRGASSLAIIDMPLITRTDGFCFNSTAIEYAVFQALRNIYGGQDFASCTNLKGADFGGTFASGDRGIANLSFSNDTQMSVLILRSSAAWALQNINAFNNTPFASGKAGGTLYVPQALISSYQGATNWSTILGYANNQIKAIEGSTYETHYVDGTSIS